MPKIKSPKTAKKTLTVTECTDYQRLWPLLKEKTTYGDLDSLTGMALRTSSKAVYENRYKPIERAFCDGFEVKLGNITK